MQKKHARTALAASTMLLFACFLALHHHSASPARPHLNKQDRIQFAIDQEIKMTADPALGIVPRARLLDARSAADGLRRQNIGQRNGIFDLIWQEKGPSNVGGRTRTLLIDANDFSGNTLFAGSVSGGLWKTVNGLAAAPTWEKVNDAMDNLAITSICQNKNNPKIIYYGTGEGWYNQDAVRGMGVWKSENGGITWARLPASANPNFYFVQKIISFGQNNLLVATRNGGLQRSTDGGTTFHKVLGKNIADCVTDRAADIEVASDGNLFASFGIFDQGGIFKSENEGQTWQKLSIGLPTFKVHRIELTTAPTNPKRIYAMVENGADYTFGGIYRSDNSGDSWQPMSIPKPLAMNNLCREMAWYCMAAAVDPINENRLIIGGIDLFETTDAGQNWQQISQWHGGFQKPFVHADQHAILFKNGDSNIFFCANDGGVFRGNSATNGSKIDFNFIANGYNVTQYYGCAMSPAATSDLVIAGAQDNGTQLFDQEFGQNAGSKQATTVTGGDGGYCHIDRDNPKIQVSSYVFSTINITNDGWATYEQIPVGQGDEGLFTNPSVYDDLTNTLFIAHEINQIGLLRDVGGENLTEFRQIQLNNSYITCFSMVPNVQDCLLLGLANGDLMRMENCRSANPILSLVRDGNGWPSSVAVEPANANHWILTYANYGVFSIFETKNAGLNWTAVEGNLPDMPVRWAIFVPNEPEKMLIATEIGVWATEKLEAENTVWQPANGGLANVRTDMLVARASDGRILAATHGRGLFETRYFSGENACATPTNLSIITTTDSSATLGWNRQNESDTVELRVREIYTNHWKSMTYVANIGKIEPLLFSKTYEWQIFGKCKNGTSTWSATQLFTTKNPTPTAPPTGLRADDILDKSAFLNWEQPTAPTLGFDLKWREKGRETWNFTHNFQKNDRIIEELFPARHYEYAVRTRGKYGLSDWSASFMFTTSAAGAGCPPPNGLKTVNLQAKTATIRWFGAPESQISTVRWKKSTGHWQTAQTTVELYCLENLTAGSTYFYQIASNCGGGTKSIWSEMNQFTTPPELQCATQADGEDEWIERFQLADFQRITGKNNGYLYFADTPISLNLEAKYPIQIQPGFPGVSFSENYAVWLDGNQNGEFEHPKELVFSQTTTKDSLIFGEIEIPKITKLGLTHLRVMLRYSPITDACGEIAWGEVEDYLVKIKPITVVFDPHMSVSAANSIFLSDGKSARLWPNPATDWIKIDFPNAGNCQILNSLGQTVAAGKLSPGENDLSLQHLPRGIYTLILRDEKEQIARQILKE